MHFLFLFFDITWGILIFHWKEGKNNACLATWSLPLWLPFPIAESLNSWDAACRAHGRTAIPPEESVPFFSMKSALSFSSCRHSVEIYLNLTYFFFNHAINCTIIMKVIQNILEFNFGMQIQCQPRGLCNSENTAYHCLLVAFILSCSAFSNLY